MKPLILLVAATLLTGAAPARHAAPYEASGFEPSWDLRIERGRLIYDSGTGEPVINIPLPRRQAVRNGYRYVSRQLTVDVRHGRCDSYNGRIYADTVRPSLAVEDGCGGTPIAPSTLAYSAWSIDAVAGLRPPGNHDTYQIGFREGRITVGLGCRDLGGTYRERRPALIVGTLSLTRNFCPISALERRLVAILRGPVRMSWIDGDTLVLTGRGGSIRLPRS